MLILIILKISKKDSNNLQKKLTHNILRLFSQLFSIQVPLITYYIHLEKKWYQISMHISEILKKKKFVYKLNLKIT